MKENQKKEEKEPIKRVNDSISSVHFHFSLSFSFLLFTFPFPFPFTVTSSCSCNCSCNCSCTSSRLFSRPSRSIGDHLDPLSFSFFLYPIRYSLSFTVILFIFFSVSSISSISFIPLYLYSFFFSLFLFDGRCLNDDRATRLIVLYPTHDTMRSSVVIRNCLSID